MSDEEDAARKRREYKREWIAKNPERHRQHSRDSAARKRAAEPLRAKERERVRKWREQNPERVKERQRAWEEANPERRREIGRASYHRNKEKRREKNLAAQAANRADPVQAKKREAWRKANRERLNELQRQRRAANPEATAAYQREWRRIEKRRVELGLPKVAKRRHTELGRRTHEHQAEEFFNRRVTKSRMRNLAKEARSVRNEAAGQRDAADKRVEAMSNRALGGYLVHRAAPELIRAEYDLINVPGFRRDLRMDLLARQIRGGPAFDLDKELWAAAGRRVFERMTRELGVPIYVPAVARGASRPKTSSERPDSSSSREQAKWWGVDAGKQTVRSKGDSRRPEASARAARDTEATRIARDAATVRQRPQDRGR